MWETRGGGGGGAGVGEQRIIGWSVCGCLGQKAGKIGAGTAGEGGGSTCCTMSCSRFVIDGHVVLPCVRPCYRAEGEMPLPSSLPPCVCLLQLSPAPASAAPAAAAPMTTAALAARMLTADVVSASGEYRNRIRWALPARFSAGHWGFSLIYSSLLLLLGFLL